MPNTNNKHLHTIRQLNNKFRSTFIGGKVIETISIRTLSSKPKLDIINRIKCYSDFSKSPDDDYSYGSFIYDRYQIFFKIDYWDVSGRHFSDAPWDEMKTNRVMTIALRNSIVKS